MVLGGWLISIILEVFSNLQFYDSVVCKDTCKGQLPLSKLLVSIVGINQQVTTQPLARAKLILSNEWRVHLTLLVGPQNFLHIDVCKGQLWVDLWGKFPFLFPLQFSCMAYKET